MSKKIFIAFGIVAFVSFTSCRKNRTCNCTTTITANGNTTQQPTDYVIADVNKEEGEAECAKYESSNTYTGFQEDITCTLLN
jgi:hypothetical protein